MSFPMPTESRSDRLAPLTRGKRAARAGILVNTALAVLKLVAGIVGNSYALVADAIESGADVAASTIVLGGLQVAGREPDERYPFGYGKAETLAGAVVAFMLFGAAIGIAVEAVREIRTPHHAPAWWTLAVLVAVMSIKVSLSRTVGIVASEIGSTAVRIDAWHHFTDALTSAAAFVGILIAVVLGPGWEAADAWAALAASAVIAGNAFLLLKPVVADLMDRAPEPEVLASIRSIAGTVDGVMAIEKLAVRRAGLGYRAVVHVQADADMPLRDAHALGTAVTRALHERLPQVQSVIVHMEPYETQPTGPSGYDRE
jgi:cation diffusion facilitator family transporter